MKSTTIWLSTREVATETGRHPVTVRRALESGVLHGGQSKAGASWRVHRDCMSAWVLGVECPHAAAKAS
ncbi:hypothetical protein NPS01_25080 [Nocardioides psychrotolerans]|uniref:Helix-turn-helix domain-containing protein n=1 Tax=Nocardioides psychrotolerans TaxID=1005945 RepID=A0A1I3LL50_9ACTN|nr:helix-turn-helix domain-containing protein [Nocardioides psychrotolerans]GEP38845.1 hypothetical protein NPS01_25080 [Nocardioides psychrotolerans]SFI85250.1 Helix-turn-helix domain-containing protein [Nocardioides psychrotolerans]